MEAEKRERCIPRPLIDDRLPDAVPEVDQPTLPGKLPFEKSEKTSGTGGTTQQAIQDHHVAHDEQRHIEVQDVPVPPHVERVHVRLDRFRGRDDEVADPDHAEQTSASAPESRHLTATRATSAAIPETR